MAEERFGSVAWDGRALTGWVDVDGIKTPVSVDLDAIQMHAPGWNDVLTREVRIHAEEIFEKLLPYFQRQYAVRDGARPRLVVVARSA